MRKIIFCLIVCLNLLSCKKDNVSMPINPEILRQEKYLIDYKSNLEISEMDFKRYISIAQNDEYSTIIRRKIFSKCKQAMIECKKNRKSIDSIESIILNLKKNDSIKKLNN